MLIIKLTYTQPLETLDKLRPAHLEFLDRYYKKGIFIASGRQNPPIGGVILATNSSKPELETIITEDPFHIQKVAEYEITEFIPNKYHPEIKNLI